MPAMIRSMPVKAPQPPAPYVPYVPVTLHGNIWAILREIQAGRSGLWAACRSTEAMLPRVHRLTGVPAVAVGDSVVALHPQGR